MRGVAGIIAQRLFDFEEEKRQKNKVNDEQEAAQRAAEIRQHHESNPTPNVEDTTDNMVD